jgi:hypothetical protein
VEKPAGETLTVERKTANKAHNRTRAVGARGNALLKWFKALPRGSLCPWRIGAITYRLPSALQQWVITVIGAQYARRGAGNRSMFPGQIEFGVLYGGVYAELL